MAQEIKQKEVKQTFDCLQEESLLSQKFRKNHNLIVIKINSVFYCYTREEMKYILAESPENPPFSIQGNTDGERRKYRENPLYWYYKLPISGHFVDHTLADLYSQKINTMRLEKNDQEVTLFRSLGVSASHDLKVESYRVEPMARCEIYDNISECDEPDYFEPENEGESEVVQGDKKQTEEGEAEMKAIMEQAKANAKKMKEKIEERKKKNEGKLYWENGQLHVQEFYNSEGRQDGERKEWYENGQLFLQEFYKNGKREGEKKEYWENGQLKVQENYKNGKQEGERKVWYENGQLKVQENYKNGVLEGERKIWYENGQLGVQINYKNGEFIEKFAYSNTGILLEHSVWKNGIKSIIEK